MNPADLKSDWQPIFTCWVGKAQYCKSMWRERDKFIKIWGKYWSEKWFRGPHVCFLEIPLIKNKTINIKLRLLSYNSEGPQRYKITHINNLRAHLISHAQFLNKLKKIKQNKWTKIFLKPLTDKQKTKLKNKNKQ